MDKELQLTVTEPTTLLPFLLQQFQNKGRNKVKSLLARRQIMIDGKMVSRHDFALQPGQTVRILGKAGPQGKTMEGIRFVYEDEHIIVIDKPPGLLSIATEEEKVYTAYHIVTDYVRTSHPKARIFIVHRLDRETSGLMMFAKSEEVKKSLQDNWKDYVLDRAYAVVCEGRVQKEKGTIETWLKESSTKTMFVSKPGDGVKAITHYERITTNGEFSLLEVHLDTGRKNQIRVHLQSIGHPVVGDKRYGGKRNVLKRLGLHARVLSFRHPVTNEVLTFDTPVPPAFRKLVAPKPAPQG